MECQCFCSVSIETAKDPPRLDTDDECVHSVHVFLWFTFLHCSVFVELYLIFCLLMLVFGTNAVSEFVDCRLYLYLAFITMVF